MDLIRQLGEMALASRLRRLSDRLMKDVSRVYAEENLEAEARWFPLLYLLREGAPRSVTEIARALGISHPGVIQIARPMLRRHILTEAKDSSDERRRLLALSPEGTALVRRLEPLWSEIALATQELCEETSSPALRLLAELESNLDRRSMYQRVRERLRARDSSAIRIAPYRPQYRKYFRSLNLEWLEGEFSIEASDAALLNDPRRKILAPGGRIFFALREEEVIGTCALIPRGEGVWELAKMAVSPAARGRGAGRRLLEAALEAARSLKARTVFLQTSPRLLAANQLYRSAGFILDSGRGLPVTTYERPSITMRLEMAAARTRPRSVPAVREAQRSRNAQRSLV